MAFPGQFRFGLAFEVMRRPLQAVTVTVGKELAEKRWRPPPRLPSCYAARPPRSKPLIQACAIQCATR